MEYTVDYFIQKFEAIPEERWGTGLESYRDNSKKERCALGHCRIGWEDLDYNCLSHEGKELCNHLVKVYKYTTTDKSGAAWGINDGIIGCSYQQPTPKQRILAALYDVKKLQEQSNRTDITKSLAVLPVDETADIILEKEKA